MKYIVFWIVLITSSAPCPDIQIDQITGLPSGVGLDCLVNHTKVDTIYRHMTFTDFAEMNQFVELLNKDSRVDSFSVTEIRKKIIHSYKKPSVKFIENSSFNLNNFQYRADSTLILKYNNYKIEDN